jgi:hypothetical protein
MRRNGSLQICARFAASSHKRIGIDLLGVKAVSE